MSDSLELIATGDGKDRLTQVLEMCACQHATGLIQKGGVLRIANDYDPHKAEQLLSFRPSLLTDAIIEWIERPTNKGGAKFGKEPDIDGHCKRGWRLVSGSWHDPIEIHPHWMIYHK